MTKLLKIGNISNKITDNITRLQCFNKLFVLDGMQMLEIILKEINPKIQELESHFLYKKINSLDSLKLFMERHAFAVFDFMSLTKSMQSVFSPIDKMWTPPKNRELSRFINEIILAEESDLGADNTYMSHFEMYCRAMDEVNADSSVVEKFIEVAKNEGPTLAAKKLCIPKSAQQFMMDTFLLIDEGKTHEIAASFCFGREKIIPMMFQSLLDEIDISENKAPTFYYYLKRHIEIDSDSHFPLALKMLTILCGQDTKKWQEVKSAALNSIESRITFWNSVSEEIDYYLRDVHSYNEITPEPRDFYSI